MKRKNLIYSSIGVFLISVGSIVPTSMLISKQNITNDYLKYIDDGFDKFEEQQNSISDEFNKIYPIDIKKYESITNLDISNLITNYYDNLYCSKLKNKNDYFLELQDDINIKYKIDSYVRKQEKRFTKIPTANIDIKYKKSRMMSNWYIYGLKKFKSLIDIIDFLDKNKINNYKKDINKLFSFIKYIYFSTIFNALNNNYNNSYKINVNNFSIHLDKKFVGNLILVPMYAKEFDWFVDSFVIDKIDISFITNILKKPINELYKLLNSKMKNLINIFYNFFSVTSTLSPMLSFDKLLPMIHINDIKKIKTKVISFGNFDILEWNALDNALYINSNNSFTTSLSMKKSECNGPICSHNHWGFNKLKVNVIKWALSVLGSDGAKDIAISLIRVMLPLLNGVTIFIPVVRSIVLISTILLNWGLDIAKNIYHKIEHEFYDKFKFLFNYENFSFEYIFDKIVRTLINFVNDNIIEIAMKYAGNLVYHGLDVGECSTALINLKIDTKNKKIPLHKDKYYVYGSSNSNNIISSLFKIYDNKIEFDKDIIVSIFELANYSYFYNFLKKDSSIPKNILNVFISNIYNLSITSEGLYKQYIDYKNKGIKPKKYFKKLPYFDTFFTKGFIINKSIKINDFALLKEQILSDIIYQNIYFNNNGKKIKLFNNGKLLDIKINNLKKLDNKNYIYIDFKEIGNKLN